MARCAPHAGHEACGLSQPSHVTLAFPRRPLYIYGPDSAKDYQQWMMDRILRDRPVCIPSPGIQCTSMTHVEDVASMLACVPGNEAAIGQDFNAGSDR